MNINKANYCAFCDAPHKKGESIRLFHELYGIDQIIEFPELPSSFFVLQDLVSLGVHGAHLLLLPRLLGNEHNISLASFQNQKEISYARTVIISALQDCFPGYPIFVFEHGPGFINSEPVACGSCHVDHAHAHILVLPKNTTHDVIIAEVEKTLVKSGWMTLSEQKALTSGLLTELRLTVGINPYLHFGMIYPDGVVDAYTCVQRAKNQQIEAQLFRRIIAEVVYGETNAIYWNWRDVSSGFTSKERLHELQQNVAEFRKLYQARIL